MNSSGLESIGVSDLLRKDGTVSDSEDKKPRPAFDSIATIERKTFETWRSFNLLVARRLGELGLPLVNCATIEAAYKKGCGRRDFFVPGDLTASMLLKALDELGAADIGCANALDDFEIQSIPTQEGVVRLDLAKLGRTPIRINLPFGCNYKEHKDIATCWFGGIPTLEHCLYAILLGFVVNGSMPFKECDIRCANPCHEY